MRHCRDVALRLATEVLTSGDCEGLTPNSRASRIRTAGAYHPQRAFQGGDNMMVLAHRKIPTAVCVFAIICLSVLAVQGQQPSVDLAGTWSQFSKTLSPTSTEYGVSVASNASKGLIVAPPSKWLPVFDKVPQKGAVIGYLYTSGVFAPGRYRLEPGAYSVILQSSGVAYAVEFRLGQTTMATVPVTIEQLPSPAPQPQADLSIGRPCYTVDSRRICP